MPNIKISNSWLNACMVLLLFLTMPAEPATAKGISLNDAFSPDQGATALVIKTIDGATRSIKVAAYSFTSRPIADALVRAQAHGVSVWVVLDKTQRKAHARVGRSWSPTASMSASTTISPSCTTNS